MDTFLIKAAQLILAFAILVIIHEFGHFFFARIFGVKVEKFYIFFDPWIELFKWKPKKYFGGFGKTKNIGNDNTDGESAEPVKKKRKKSFWGDTEYGIGWLPLGGYCCQRYVSVMETYFSCLAGIGESHFCLLHRNIFLAGGINESGVNQDCEQEIEQHPCNHYKESLPCRF